MSWWEEHDSNAFWIGPFGVKVPQHYLYVVDNDGSSKLERDESIFSEPRRALQRAFRPHMSRDAYLQKYAYLDEKDGAYHYRGPHNIEK